MRTTFIKTLMDLAARDKRIWLLTGDLGYSVLEPFARQFPDRYLNVGVAEQNMTGVAAGLASCGHVVFTYSIANFPTLRCLEQIRNDACYHELPVKVVSVGGGYAYGPQGYTHHGLEDLGAMRLLPNMTVVAPGDPVETDLAVRAVVDLPGPCYLRLGKAGEPLVHHQVPDFALGRAIRVREGADVTLMSIGSMLKHTMEVAQKLAEEESVQARVLSMHTLKPLDRQAIRDAFRETRGVVTVEEHSVTGGLGSAVADAVMEMGGPYGPLRKYGAPDRVNHVVGSQKYLQRLVGSVADLVHQILEGAAP